MVLSAQKAKASPRGRASYRRAKAPPAPFFVGVATRGECEGSACSKPSFAPRSGLLQKSQSAARAASVGAATPRRKRWFCQLKSKSFAPRSGLLQKSQSAARAVFCGSRNQRRMRRLCPPKSQKLRPEVGPPTEEPKRRFCGSRDPAANTMVLSAQKQRLRREGGAPTSTAAGSVVSSTATAQPADVPPIACPESASAALALR